MAWRVRRKARPVGPRRPPLDSARPQRPKSAAVAPWVDLDCSAGSDRVYRIHGNHRQGGGALEQVARLGKVSMCLGGWSLGRGEGRLEVPFGRFFEAIVTLDLALDLDVQATDSATLAGCVQSSKSNQEVEGRSRHHKEGQSGRRGLTVRWFSTWGSQRICQGGRQACVLSLGDAGKRRRWKTTPLNKGPHAGRK